MNEPDSFSDPIYEKQTNLAERDRLLSTVAALYGREQAELSAQHWLDESDLIDGPPRSEERDWHERLG